MQWKLQEIDTDQEKCSLYVSKYSWMWYLERYIKQRKNVKQDGHGERRQPSPTYLTDTNN